MYPLKVFSYVWPALVLESFSTYFSVTSFLLSTLWFCNLSMLMGASLVHSLSSLRTIPTVGIAKTELSLLHTWIHMVKTLNSQCMGLRLDPWSGN